ncbi:DNA-binding protein [Pseudogulbenkiania subflava]|uniref:Replication region DNA-binding N-term n=1 Tax=Pseudogulbenkiania subflava DSM 22618 TaxID=1123014 RepID=A0A1Y6C2D2_9NEIS|nr:DNA-binding protein [Pseudogulbenkiania subflava]SMF23690.1 replication region DNA-binding N-term [Pseudogulbenkiania subflava DSM 22618]SMF33043.1 replication region DNA-binding N-term [Pseudogulbenkiania subflava DSM 22618]SMF48033.1 replication region DNA-binding N-term [Pseudogulbenkiania subflava DSM 22618]
MARAGIYKSEVQKARDALLAQGINPSIDAVRAELGNTGSKTTIHRYLKELEEEEGAGFGRGVAVSEAIQDLVGRLAARLHEEAEARVSELQARHVEQLAQHDKAVAKLKQEIEGLSSHLQRTEATLQTEQAAHEQTRQAQQAATLLNAQLEQQVADLKERLAENAAHRQSLEDKHRHAREALEHYRESVKEQREQEQRRHEQQVQQLQAELRTLNQTLIVKQNELTHAYQDAARTGAELVATRKELRRSEQAAENAGKARDVLQGHATHLETSVATLNERLQQLSASRDELWQLLQGKSESVIPNTQGNEGEITMDLFNGADRAIDPNGKP